MLIGGLIYRCKKCKHSWNLAIHERIRPSKIKQDDYKLFLENDYEFALKYGNDMNHETDNGWYLCIDGEKIVAGMGVIENDFHDRKDLAPNICAVYTEEEYRCKGIAGNLLG